MKRIVSAVVVLLVLAAPACVETADKRNTDAGVDDGLAAYQRGDYATALREFRPLAEQGDAKVQGLLGNMYFFGRGVPQDDAEAARWYARDADRHGI